MADYEHSQVAHFRHCVRIESVAEAYRTLHATVYPSSYNNLAIIESLTFDEASSAGYQYDGSLFWIYPGRPEDPEGCCYIASTLSIANQLDSRQLCHNIFRASSSQAQCYMRADNDWSTSEQWYIVDRGDGEFSIHAAGDDACLTANLSGGIASFSTYDGSANQRWRLMTQYSPMGGVFHVAPSLDDSQAMQCLTDSNMAFASIGSSSQKGTHSALVSEFVNQLESPTSLVGSFATDLSYPINRAETKWNRSNIFDSTSKRIQFATGDRKLSSSLGTRNGAWVPEGDGGGLITTTGLGGTFKAQKWLYPVSGTPLALSSYDGENRLGAFPTGQTSTSDPMDQTQHWWMLPANLYDDALPVPYDVRIRLRNNNSFFDLTSTQVLPIDDDVTCSLYPAFRCDHSQFRIIFRMKYLVDGVWEDWDRVLEPSNGNISSTSAAPYALLGGGPGWIPNAWSWDTYQGYDTTAPAEVTGGIFDGHDDATACLISMSVTPMRYGEFTGQPPLPYEGRTITTDAIVSRHVTASLSSAAVTKDGIEFGLSVDGVSGASEFTTHVTSIGISHSGDFTTHEYLDHAVDCEMGGQTVGRYDATIPFTELCAMDSFLLGSSVDTSTVEISGSIRTEFGDTEFRLSHAFGSGFSSIQYPSTENIANPWLGYLGDIYFPRDSAEVQLGFLTLTSERGTRIVPISRIWGLGFPIYNRAGTYLGADTDITSQIGVVLVQMENAGSWGYCIVNGRQHPYHQIPCIFRRRDEQDDTDHIEVIPLQGNISTSFSAKNDVTVRRRLGGRRSVVGTLGGQQSELQFTGAIFRDQLSDVEGLPSSMSGKVIMRQDIQVLYEISPDETLILRTAHGTAYAVRLVSIDSPRDNADLANVTLSFVEVES